MPNLNELTPAAPTGEQLIVWQYDTSTPTNVTAYDPPMVGDTGAGGVAGNVPAPNPGDAAAGCFLAADGTFSVPTGGFVLTVDGNAVP